MFCVLHTFPQKMLQRTLLLCALGALVSLAKGNDNVLIEIFGTTTEQNRIDSRTDSCVCVPYYLCRNDSIVTDGSWLVDIRMGKGQEQSKGQGQCSNYIDVCCKEPKDKPVLPMPSHLQKRSCGQRNTNGIGFRITGDSNGEAQFGEFPWMIALLKVTAKGELIYFCGGALIHRSLVLTTAHCVSRNLEDSVRIMARAGEWDSLIQSEIYKHEERNVTNIIIHPKYRSDNVWNDFALLEIDKPFILSDYINTICLPSTEYERDKCYASGWGADLFGNAGYYQNILKKVDLPLVTNEDCTRSLRNTRLGPFFILHQSFICAGGKKGKDTCKGDGGSPLVCQIKGKEDIYEVIGLVAWGIGCGDEIPGVYASVGYARNWIERMMLERGYYLN